MERKLERKRQQTKKGKDKNKNGFTFGNALGAFGGGRGAGKGKSKGKDKSKGKGKKKSGKDRKGRTNSSGGSWICGDPNHYAKNCPQSCGRVNQIEADGGWTNEPYNGQQQSQHPDPASASNGQVHRAHHEMNQNLSNNLQSPQPDKSSIWEIQPCHLAMMFERFLMVELFYRWKKDDC